MSADTKKLVQVVLAIAILAALVRVGVMLYSRGNSTPAQKQPKQEKPLEADYYVSPKKLYAYDLKSARALMQQPVWVKEGYRYTYYPYDRPHHRADLGHESGALGPIERLEIKDVFEQPVRVPMTAGDQKISVIQQQLLAAFEKDGTWYAVPVGRKSGSDYQIYADEMFYYQEPRELYKHWPADVWSAIEKHEPKPGMNELQAGFAIGMGVPEISHEEGVKVVKYPNGGKPIQITYRNGRAAEIKPQA